MKLTKVIYLKRKEPARRIKQRERVLNLVLAHNIVLFFIFLLLQVGCWHKKITTYFHSKVEPGQEIWPGCFLRRDCGHHRAANQHNVDRRSPGAELPRRQLLPCHVLAELRRNPAQAGQLWVVQEAELLSGIAKVTVISELVNEDPLAKRWQQPQPMFLIAF